MAISPAEVEKYLEEMHYPASKLDLNRKARDNHAPAMIIDLINNLSGGHRFNSPADVDKAIGDIE